MNLVSDGCGGSCSLYAGISLLIGFCSEDTSGLSVYMMTLKETERES